jgi:hypothetical protein
MTEREKQHQFLKQLIRADSSDKCRELQARISKAERDERCIRSAVFLVVVLALLSAAGLGYSAVLLPEFFENTTPLLVKVFSALVLTSLICLLGFCGFWLWYRGVCDRIYNECRNWIISLHKPVSASRNSFPTIVHKEGVQVYTIATPDAEHETQIITFPHASF